MPTLFRFLMTLAVFAGIVYGAMVGLVLYVKPQQAEMTYRIPTDRLNRATAAASRSAQAPATTSAAPAGATASDNSPADKLPADDNRPE